MKALVISLNRAEKRQSVFFDHAQQQGWEVDLFDAVERNDLLIHINGGEGQVTSTKDPSISLKLKAEAGDAISLGPGHCACALSHMKIWEMVVREALDAVVVFEDDAVLLRPPVFEPWPDDADFIFLSNRVKAVVPDEIESEADLEEWVKQNPYSLMVPGCGTEAYIVTQSGAEKALKIMKEMFKPVDLQIMGCAKRASPVGDPPRHTEMPECVMYATTECYTNHIDEGISYVNEGESHPAPQVLCGDLRKRMEIMAMQPRRRHAGVTGVSTGSDGVNAHPLQS
jgi:GR25 family glycosyltransferase involved in LPS biosynthesis